jgi:hypothetical protein
MSLHVLGIRHHGPGSSRHVLEALAAIKPDIILIEGPPEGEPMLQWVNHAAMQPPVALLCYVPDSPSRSVFYPFTSFSPEWNAIKYGLENKIPLRFIDMPLVHTLAESARDEAGEENAEPGSANFAGNNEHEDYEKIRRNPIAYLADIAGYEDAEEWWEQCFEIGHHPTGVFEAVATAMTALRDTLPQKKDTHEATREAFMRKAIRAAQREMYTEIAVICGAWHVPALLSFPKQKDDDALTKNLPKVKVETTWIPWTNDRLSFESGYGAGVASPGWYDHAWKHPDDNGVLWQTYTAQVFRQHQIDISSAHVIESVKLVNALTALRGLGKPGLKEFNESTLAVMCMGDPVFMKLVHRELIVGRTLGQIPEGTPQVPVQRDLDQLIKKCRLKISNEEKLLKLDLREDNDLQKSVLLHRLQLLGVEWGRMQFTSGKGTFKEEWMLCWYPELTIRLLEKAPWGNTIEAAADKYLQDRAARCTGLNEITALVQQALPSELHTAIRYTLKRMDELAAGTSDCSVLIDAFLPLVQVSRYGNVRRTDLEIVTLLLTAIFYRMTAGLPMSCTGIDDEQAATMAEKLKLVTRSVLLLEDAVLKTAWMDTIRKTAAQQQAAATVQGCCCKVLYDARELTPDATATEFSKALSVNNNPDFSANWLEGFLKDAATVLILEDEIWDIVNGWMTGLDETTFLQIIPLLRRTFAVFSNVEKQKIASRAQRGSSKAAAVTVVVDIDHQRAQKVLPLMELLMGL